MSLDINYCRLCLQKTEGSAKTLSKGSKIFKQVTLLFPDMDTSLVINSKLCKKCCENVQYSNLMVDTVTKNEQKLLLDLQNSQLFEKPTCRLCLSNEKLEAAVCLFKNLNEEARHVIEIAIIDLNFDIFRKPVLCNSCWEGVKSIYLFKKKFFATEEILKYYCHTNKVNLLDRKELEMVSSSKEEFKQFSENLEEDNDLLDRISRCIDNSSLTQNFVNPQDMYLNNFIEDKDSVFEEVPYIVNTLNVQSELVKEEDEIKIMEEKIFEFEESDENVVPEILNKTESVENEQFMMNYVLEPKTPLSLKCEECLSETGEEVNIEVDLKAHQSMEKIDLISKYKYFSQLNMDEKLEIKRSGRPMPDLNIEVSSTSRGKHYTRKFNKSVYENYGWICGCDIKNRLFCFACVLFGGEKRWTINGIDDLVHLTEKAKLHAKSKQHLTNQMRLTLLGKGNIQEQLTAYCNNSAVHNEKVAKNRLVLSKIIEAIKFCGTFELALRGHDESPGIFQGLINYTAQIDKTLKEDLERATGFKGTSEEIENDLLDCIFEVYREVVATEIQNADFLGIMADDTTDVSSKLQTVLVFRYVKDGKAVERFWGFFTSEQQTAEVLSRLILKELEPLVARNPNKLIAQSYDGAAVMSGLQARIKEQYPMAHFVHCYAHQLNLIMSQAASQNNDVRLFFGNISEIPTFFSNSSQRVAFLDRIVKRKIPRSVPTSWDFKSRTVNVVFEYKEELRECMEEIEETPGVDMATKNQAGAIRRLLQEKSFIFWLTFFHYVMPQVDILFNELQKRIIDSVEIGVCLNKFTESISNIRNQKIGDILNEAKSVGVNETKRRKLNEDTWKASAIKVCDVVINVAEDRFACTNQLNAANLFICEKFEWYDRSFPIEYFQKTVESYPMLEKNRLKIELTVLYSSTEFRNYSSCAVLIHFLIDSNLQEVFTETIKLLQILVTMPMTTVEAERNFSSLKGIKSFLRSTKSQDRLNALACLSIEQKLIRSLPDFNDRVIEKFALKKDRRIDLVFKKS